jgi:hypothetical protein
MISSADAAMNSRIGALVRSAGFTHHAKNGKAAAATMLLSET